MISPMMTNKSYHMNTSEDLNSTVSTVASPSFIPRPLVHHHFNLMPTTFPIDYVKEFQQDPKYKTELCKTFKETGHCAYGRKCRFAHGRQELFDKIISCKKYKQKECASFYTRTFCSYGSRCHFKHEDRKLKEIERSFHTYALRQIQTIDEKKIWNMSGEEVHNLVTSSFRKTKSFVASQKEFKTKHVKVKQSAQNSSANKSLLALATSKVQ